jgi:hypothetical protein
MSVGGVRGAKLIVGELNRAILSRVGKHVNFGTRCFEEDWEVFIILDACRHDVMQEVAEAEEYDFLPENIPIKYSCASTSEEYVQKAFTKEFTDEINDTALISTNLWPEKHREELDLDERFAEFTVKPDGWMDDVGYMHPNKVTDTAIKYWRERPESVKRMVVWYAQPHAPYPSLVEKHDLEMSSNEVFEKLMSGELRRYEVWDGYYDTLIYVLEEVDELLENIDAEQVVISADHGEAFGEFGIYRHPKYVPLPMLKQVPWVRTTAKDEKTRKPDGLLDSSEELTTDEIDDHLKQLGYL